MQPGMGGNREGLGSGPDRQHSAGNAVDRGIVLDSAAHARVEVDGQDIGPRGQRQRITADPRAQVNDQRTGESSGFVPGDRLRRGLLDCGRLDPHLLTALELHLRFLTSPGQANGSGDGRGRGQFSKSFQVRRPDRSNLGDLSEQAASGLGRQDPGLGPGVPRAGARALLG